MFSALRRRLQLIPDDKTRAPSSDSIQAIDGTSEGALPFVLASCDPGVLEPFCERINERTHGWNHATSRRENRMQQSRRQTKFRQHPLKSSRIDTLLHDKLRQVGDANARCRRFAQRFEAVGHEARDVCYGNRRAILLAKVPGIFVASGGHGECRNTRKLTRM